MLNINYANTGIYDAFVIYQLNESANIYTSATNFNTTTFDNPTSLILKGGQIKTWKDGASNVTGGGMQYRIYKCNTAVPGFTYCGVFNWLLNEIVTPTNQYWEKVTDNVDIISSLTPGVYYFEVYFESYTTADGNKYYSNAGANYKAKIIIYNKSIVATGNWNTAGTWANGIPSATDPVWIQAGHNITLDVDATASNIIIDGTFNGNTQKLTLTSCETSLFTNNATFNANTGSIVFSGKGLVSGNTTFNNVEIAGYVDFGTLSTINGILSINTNGVVFNNVPTYTASSTLKYNTGGAFTRNMEWTANTTTNPGYPATVQISNNTNFTLDNCTNDLYCRKLIVDLGSTFNYCASAKSLKVAGDVLVNGLMQFGSTIGGDLYVGGNFERGASGVLDWTTGLDVGRAVFFTGTGTQVLTNIPNIPFVLVTSTGTVQLANSDLTIDGAGTDFISITGGGHIDLNNHNIISTGSGNIDLGNVAGATIIGSGRLEFNGGNGTFSNTTTGTLTLGTGVTLAINGGTLTFPGTLNVVTLNGTLEVGDGATISSLPTYGGSSTLHYKKADTFEVGTEWQDIATIPVNIPFNVTVSQGSSASIFNFKVTRTALGILTIETGATMNVYPVVGQLTVNDLTVNAGGAINLKSASDATATGSLITNGIVIGAVGTMNAERWLRTDWSYFSIPFPTASESLFNPVLNPSVSNTMYYNESANLYPIPSVPAPLDIFHPDSLKRGWNFVANAAILNLGTGYITNENVEKTVTFTNATGEAFNTQDKSITLTYNNNDNNTNCTPQDIYDGWNLIGNPYPSAVDADLLTFTNVDRCIYYWDGAKYIYYINGSGSNLWSGTNTNGGGVDKIPAMQAFFVHANAAAPTVTFHNADRVHATQNYYKSNNIAGNIVRLKITNGTLTDDCLIHLNANATNDYDGDYDALKLFASSGLMNNIYTYSNNNRMAINSLSLNNYPTTIPVGLKCETGNYTISASEVTFENMFVFLKDKSNNNMINLRTQTLNFDYTQVDEISDKFEIQLIQNTAPVANGTFQTKTLSYGADLNYQIEDIFSDENQNLGDNLTLSAKLSDGNNLPTWLLFDSQTRTFTGTPSQAGNYNITITATDILDATVESSFEIIVNKAILNVSTNNASRNYGTENPNFELNYNGFVLDEDFSNLTTEPSINCTANQTSDAGDYAIVVMGGESLNYEFDYTNAILTINKIDLNVSTNNITRSYGVANPVFEIVYDGFVFNQNIDVLLAQPFANCSANITSNAGIYPIIIYQTGDATNYNFVYPTTNANLTVLAVAPQISLTEISNLTQTTATVNGNLISQGGDITTVKGICWATTNLPTIANSNLELGTSTGLFSTLINNLTQNTTYYVRTYAINDFGTVYSTQLSFKTLAINDILNDNSIIKIYPNPAKDFINIENANASKIEIYNLNGQKLNVLDNINQTNQKIDLSQYSAGIYFIKIIGLENTKIVKFEKQ